LIGPFLAGAVSASADAGIARFARGRVLIPPGTPTSPSPRKTDCNHNKFVYLTIQEKPQILRSKNTQNMVNVK
jgi:hypothetical protein